MGNQSPNVAAFLYLPALTRTVFFRPYLAELDARPILRMLAERVLSCSGASRLVILHHYPAEEEALLQAVDGSGAELLRTPHFNELQAVADAAAQDASEQIALLRLGCALTPADLLRRVVEFHRQQKNTFTIVDGLPKECCPSVYQVSLLSKMAQLAGTFNFSCVEDAACRLFRLQFTAKRRVLEELHSVPFDFRAAYAMEQQQISSAIPLREMSEFAPVEEAIRTVRQQQGDPDSTDLLIALRQLEIRRKADELKLPADCVLASSPKKNTPPRVLYFSLPSAFSGAEQSLCSMLKFLDHTRYQPFAITARSGVFADTLRAVGVEVICPEKDVVSSTAANFNFMLQLFRRLRPDILHLNGNPSLATLAAAAVCNMAVVLHLRNGDMNGFEDAILQSRASIAVSEFLKREALRFPVAAEKIHVIYDETDCELFRPDLFSKQECRRQLGLDADAKIALMVARVAPNKRHDLMLEAAALALPRVPGFRLVIKGDVHGDSVEHFRLRDLQHKLELDSVVRWIDYVPDMRQLMAAADCLVLCSDREGLGSCVVEALSMALPVVVTDSGGSHEIVRDHISGGLVTPGGDAVKLSEAIVELLADEALRQRLGAAGREFARTYLDARVSARAVMDLYDAVLKEQ
jgi:glycosyltransferase involved in cell wall biosynthesis/spore coat polysaccharide biosynthesis protein SpsF (cytidylyltransferase family)